MIRFSLSDENNYIKPDPTEDYYELSFRANDENMSLYLNAGTYYLTTQKPSFSTYTELDYSLELIFTSSNIPPRNKVCNRHTKNIDIILRRSIP